VETEDSNYNKLQKKPVITSIIYSYQEVSVFIYVLFS